MKIYYKNIINLIKAISRVLRQDENYFFSNTLWRRQELVYFNYKNSYDPINITEIGNGTKTVLSITALNVLPWVIQEKVPLANLKYLLIEFSLNKNMVENF